MLKKHHIIELILFISIIGISFFVFFSSKEQKIVFTGEKEKVKNYNDILRNQDVNLLSNTINENTIFVLGSSELSSKDQIAFPPYLTNTKGSNCNILLLGTGHNQSLFHTLSVGAYSEILPKKKIVYIVSPQWFTPEGNPPEAFASRFSEELYIQFIKNSSISKELKEIVSEKVFKSLVTNPKAVSRIEKINSVYLFKNANLIEICLEKLYERFVYFANRYKLLQKINQYKSDYSDKTFNINDFDFTEKLSEATEKAKQESTNNNFYIENSYFNMYVKDNLEDRKDSAVNDSYCFSPEYDDFRLFLDTCEACEIEPLIISVPVHGLWYDWTGFPKEDRETYYQTIRDICNEYNVQLSDFSDKEYEEYFLKDIMHIGWKGWVYLDEEIFNFYKK